MGFVVSAGSLATVGYTAARPAYAAQLSADVTADYGEIWRTQQAVRTVVSFLARNIAQLGLHLYRRTSDTDRERLRDHPLAALIAQPSPTTTRYRLLDSLLHDLGIYDAGYLLKVRTDGRSALVRLPPSRVTLEGDSWLAPSGFRLHHARGSRVFPADQVVYMHGYSPDDPRSGVPPIEALRRVLAEEYAAGQYRDQVLRNGGRLSGYISRPATAPRWEGKAKQRFRADWQSQYTGQGPSAGGTPILEDGMTFEAVAQTAEQLQYIEARKLTREESAAAYHVSPVFVGILDHATFSNITEQHKNLYQDTLGPWLTMIVEDLALQLLPDFDTSGELYLEFNLAEKLRGSFEEQAKQLQAAVGAPWLTRNEARARMNLPAIAGGDDLVVPLNVLTGDLAWAADSDGTEAAATGQSARPATLRVPSARATNAEALAGFFARQAHVLRSRLGAAKARGETPSIDDVWDGPRWDRELTQHLAAAGPLPAAAAAGYAAALNAAVRDRVAAALATVGDPAVALTVLFDPPALRRSAADALVMLATASLDAGPEQLE